jgi:hypothetical protein
MTMMPSGKQFVNKNKKFLQCLALQLAVGGAQSWDWQVTPSKFPISRNREKEGCRKCIWRGQERHPDPQFREPIG